MMDYMVCSSRSIEGLKRQVRDRLKDSWRPQGGVCVCELWLEVGKNEHTGRADLARRPQFYQALVREER